MEEWKRLKNFPDYEGSTEGRIRNIRTQHILSPMLDRRGYPQVSMYLDKKQRTVRVHKLIGETFMDDRDGMDIRHRDNDRTNNRVDNLYLSTRKETINDAFRRGSKLPSRQIPIRVVETGIVYESLRACCRDTGCSPSEIRNYLNGKVKHVKGLHFEEP
jgi:hypothetical protein